MRLQIALMAAAAALSAGGAKAASVEIRDAVARITVIPEARNDVKVEVVRANPDLPIVVRNEGGRTVVDGGLFHRIRNCGGSGENSHIRVSGVGNVDWNERPQIVIHTPREVSLSANGAVTGEIGRSGGVDLATSGCGGWTIADVAGEASIRASGAGSVRMGQAERLDAHLSGAGSLHATRLARGMDARLSGAGGVTVEDISGPVVAQVSGVGRVKVTSGRVSALRASVSGVGGVDFGGVADSLDASISGMGSIRVKQVTGEVRKSVSGIGHVSIGD
jgi:hypothetical protein